MKKFKCKLKFKKQDCWIGFYWEKRRQRTFGLNTKRVCHLWICVLPMLPLHIQWKLKDEDQR